MTTIVVLVTLIVLLAIGYFYLVRKGMSDLSCLGSRE